ncbi:MAG: tRNA lysidine(34) synthetase TilS [Oscillospiraceae bacterium]|nr:tRNA lysidine(34) synthetase TilS [Oscillospiraceae bacterium]
MSDFIGKIREFADEFSMLGVSRVLVGVSGGADSTACLRALVLLAPEYGYALTAAHFDHRLRGEESDRDREFVRDMCARFGIELAIGYGDTRDYAKQNSIGIEEAARDLRYAFFRETAQSLGDAVIATAHNADDNAETMLLNLARGAGARGLAGIPPVNGALIRPMLCVSRTEIEDFLDAEELAHIEDSSNADTAFARNKLRQLVIPVLREINPRFLEHAAASSRVLREDDAYLDELAEDFVAAHSVGDGVPASALYALPRPVAARVIDHLTGIRLPRERIAETLELCASTAGVRSLDLPGVLVRRERGTVRFLPPRPPRR